MLNGCTLSGCEDYYIETGIVGRETSEKLLGFLSDKDADGLKSMFCPIILSLDDIDEQIQGALDFFEGEIISYDSIWGLKGGGSNRLVRENREITRFDISPYLKNIETNAGRIYEIGYYSYVINSDYKNRIGVSEIFIRDEDGREFIIGDYYLVNPHKQR